MYLVIRHCPAVLLVVNVVNRRPNNRRTSVREIAEFQSVSLTKHGQTENDPRPVFHRDSIGPFVRHSGNVAQRRGMKGQFLPPERGAVSPGSQNNQIGHRDDLLINWVVRLLHHRENILPIGEKLPDRSQKKFQIVRTIRWPVPVDLHAVEVVRLEETDDRFPEFLAVKGASFLGQLGEQLPPIRSGDRDEHTQRWVS